MTTQTSLASRLAEFFRDRPGAWVDGRALGDLAGVYAWRTRVSDLRRAPFRMVIANRQRRIVRPDGSAFVISEYKFVQESPPRMSASMVMEAGGVSAQSTSVQRELPGL